MRLEAGEEKIADEAAETDPEGPDALRRQRMQRREPGAGGKKGQGQADEGQPGPGERAVEAHAQAPGEQHRRQDPHGEPEDLQHEVGHHSTGRAHRILGRGPGRMVEGGVTRMEAPDRHC